MVNKFDFLAAKRNQTMRDWESVMAAAALHRQQMYASLQSYKDAIDRAMTEITTIKQAAREVLAYKAAIQKDIDQLDEFQQTATFERTSDRS